MEQTLALARSVSLRVRLPSLDRNALTAWGFAFGFVGYLGLRGGGYDPVVRSELGILTWWFIALGAITASEWRRVGWRAWGALGLLIAFAGWTALSLLWTETTEQTVAETSRSLAYVSFLVAALLVSRRAKSRHMIHGLACGIVLVTVVALLSRLKFAWFTPPAIALLLPGSANRLSYPINYWNALAALTAIGVPLLLYSAATARRVVVRGAAIGAIPLLVLCDFLAVSRGGVVYLALAVFLFVALAPDRLPKLGVLLVAGAGSVLLIVAAQQRSAVRDGLRTPLAAHQGNRLLLICCVVTVGVALLGSAIALVEAHASRPQWLVFSRRAAARTGLALAAVTAIAFFTAGGVGFTERQWHTFKSTSVAPVTNSIAGLSNPVGHGRYQIWQAATNASAASPWQGRGAGAFQFWWARTGKTGYVHDAHSLYLQAYAELGLPGLLLISSFLLLSLGCGVLASIRTSQPESRTALAASTAGIAVFAVCATVEWIWFIAVLPVALFVLVAVVHHEIRLGGPTVEVASPPRGPSMGGWRSGGARASVCVASLVALLAIAVPMAATEAVNRSQALSRQNRLGPAVAQARVAVRLQPYSASAQIQEALVLEQEGAYLAALTPAQRATANEPTNWRTWYVQAQLQALTGDARGAIASYRRARLLNPRSPIFRRA